MVRRIHGDFNPRAFFNKIYPKYLFEYFEKYELAVGLLNKSITNHADYFCGVLERIHDDIRGEIEEELRLINDMTNDRGRYFLQNEFRSHRSLKLGDFDNHNLSIYLFLNYPNQFKRAWEIAHIEEMHGWKQCRLAQSNRKITFPIKRRKDFETNLSSLYKDKGFGEECHVHYFKHHERHIFQINYQGYLKSEETFSDNGEMISVSRRSMRYAAAIFFPQNAVLRIKDHKHELVEGIKWEFANSFCDNNDSFKDFEDKVIELDVFREEPLFETDSVDQIQYVKLIMMKIRSYLDKNTVVTISGFHTEDVYKKIKDFNIVLNNYYILEVKLRFKFPGKGNSGQRTIHIKVPDYCNLCDNEIEQKIDSYLRRWGILSTHEPVEDQFKFA